MFYDAFLFYLFKGTVSIENFIGINEEALRRALSDRIICHSKPMVISGHRYSLELNGKYYSAYTAEELLTNVITEVQQRCYLTVC